MGATCGILVEVFPIELLRVLLGLIGVGSAFMAGQTMAAVRLGQLKAGRHYAWMARAMVCLAALAFRHTPDALSIGAWALAVAAFAGGWHHASHHASHQEPSEDLSHDIVPRDE
jgi:hypothetical protein